MIHLACFSSLLRAAHEQAPIRQLTTLYFLLQLHAWTGVTASRLKSKVNQRIHLRSRRGLEPEAVNTCDHRRVNSIIHTHTEDEGQMFTGVCERGPTVPVNQVGTSVHVADTNIHQGLM